MSTWNSEQSNHWKRSQNCRTFSECLMLFFSFFSFWNRYGRKRHHSLDGCSIWVGFYPEYKTAVPEGSCSPPSTTSWPWLQRSGHCRVGSPRAGQGRLSRDQTRSHRGKEGQRLPSHTGPKHDLQALPYASSEAINLHLSWRFLTTGEISYLNLYYSVRDHFIFWIKQKPLAAGKQQIFQHTQHSWFWCFF